jgi:hypothetical protein
MSQEQANRVREAGDRFCNYFFHNVIPDLDTPTGREAFIFKTLFCRLAEVLEREEKPDGVELSSLERLALVYFRDGVAVKLVEDGRLTFPEGFPFKPEPASVLKVVDEVWIPAEVVGFYDKNPEFVRVKIQDPSFPDSNFGLTCSKIIIRKRKEEQ